MSSMAMKTVAGDHGAAHKGRGATRNPEGRFEKDAREAFDDGWDTPLEEEPGRPRTIVTVERARSIISRNQSPDIPFTQSINPYRGCEHGCIYCLAGKTPILMGDGRIRPLEEVKVGDELYGTERRGWYRRYVKTRVLARWSVIKPAYRIVLEDGTCLTAGADHRFLTDRGWKFVTGIEIGTGLPRPHLTTRDKLMGTGSFAAVPMQDQDYREGYLCGLIRGDGLLASYRYARSGRAHGDQHQFRLALCDEEALRRARQYLIEPAITRKREILGQAVKSAARLRVVSVEPIGKSMRLYDIMTTSEDFIANGVVSHNCYARPSHAYLNLSPGLDFETRLFAKTNAAELLQAELARPGYTCDCITIGANTDPYQPVEREWKVTRSILEVLAACNHPCAIITKNAMVERDLDILAPMAAKNLIQVYISVTTLDHDIARRMEPRASAPARRIEAIRRLAQAGVPAGVMVAPVVPFLTDSGIETVLEAAREAGADRAGYTLMRLPWEVKDLFKDWLEHNFPLKAAHVMSRVRDMRNGRENDPNFGSRMRGAGELAELLSKRFNMACNRLGLNHARRGPLDTTKFKAPRHDGQMDLF